MRQTTVPIYRRGCFYTHIHDRAKLQRHASITCVAAELTRIDRAIVKYGTSPAAVDNNTPVFISNGTPR
jgi:hypothetical protein